MLRFVQENIVWQEVPGETSLAYTVSGCPLRCPGCHSAYSWNPAQGQVLNADYMATRLDDYAGLISCVLFFGGEWQPQALLDLLRLCRKRHLNTCLYTGLEQVPLELQRELTYLKTGPWVQALGGLDSPYTNQKFYDLRTHQLMNHRFQGGNANAATDTPTTRRKTPVHPNLLERQ